MQYIKSMKIIYQELCSMNENNIPRITQYDDIYKAGNGFCLTGLVGLVPPFGLA
jgi:hypothetical protein